MRSTRSVGWATLFGPGLGAFAAILRVASGCTGSGRIWVDAVDPDHLSDPDRAGEAVCTPDWTDESGCDCTRGPCLDCQGSKLQEDGCGHERGVDCSLAATGCGDAQVCLDGSCCASDRVCGGACCAAETRCVDDLCCTPACTGLECGPDQCGGSCGLCQDGKECNLAGKCVTPCLDECSPGGAECARSDARRTCSDLNGDGGIGERLWFAPTNAVSSFDFKAFFRGRGTHFGVIIWQADYGYPSPLDSNQKSYDNAMGWAGLVHSAVSGPLDDAIVQSWDPYPQHNLPDTSGFSLTQLVCDYVDSHLNTAPIYAYAMDSAGGPDPQCVFRPKARTDSDPRRALIPFDSVHRFRAKACTRLTDR